MISRVSVLAETIAEERINHDRLHPNEQPRHVKHNWNRGICCVATGQIKRVPRYFTQIRDKIPV